MPKLKNYMPLQNKLKKYSPDLGKFILDSLALDPNKRFNSSELLQHPYFTNNSWVDEYLIKLKGLVAAHESSISKLIKLDTNSNKETDKSSTITKISTQSQPQAQNANQMTQSQSHLPPVSLATQVNNHSQAAAQNQNEKHLLITNSLPQTLTQIQITIPSQNNNHNNPNESTNHLVNEKTSNLAQPQPKQSHILHANEKTLDSIETNHSNNMNLNVINSNQLNSNNQSHSVLSNIHNTNFSNTNNGKPAAISVNSVNLNTSPVTEIILNENNNTNTKANNTITTTTITTITALNPNSNTPTILTNKDNNTNLVNKLNISFANYLTESKTSFTTNAINESRKPNKMVIISVLFLFFSFFN